MSMTVFNLLPGKKFTKTEARILAWLGDGRLHKREEYLGDTYHPTERAALATQISKIRVKLKGSNVLIVCECHGTRKYYRMVRTLTQSE